MTEPSIPKRPNQPTDDEPIGRTGEESESDDEKGAADLRATLAATDHGDASDLAAAADTDPSDASDESPAADPAVETPG